MTPIGSTQSGPDAFDIQVVEYTIACNDGNVPGPFLDNGATFDDDVTISGVLEVLDTASAGVTTQDFGPDLTEVYVWQGFMDLPPTAGCTVQLRARDADGEVICTSTEVFDIAPDTTTKVNVLMYCGISFQAPVGMLDLDGDFSFNVANFCPDLFVLNCIDSELDVQVTPFGDFLATACQVRFRDGDSSCGGTGIAPGDPDGASSCDPQTCVTTPEGLSCAPNPAAVDPIVMTTVTCASRLGACAISCDGANPAASCTFTGDTLGTIGDPPPGPGAPGEGGFFVSCATFDHDGDPSTPELPLTPGDDIACIATTTDGDTDCNKTKVVELTIPGIPPCGAFVAGGGSCADGNDCTDDVCNDATCDPFTGAGCCSNPPWPSGTVCVAPGGGLCDGAGTCAAQGCVNDNPDCNTDGNECTEAPSGSCVDNECTLAEVNVTNGAPCGVDGGAGVCVGGTCEGACTVVYDLDASFQITDTTLALGDAVFSGLTGSLAVEYTSDGADNIVDGAVNILHYSVYQDFAVTGILEVVTTVHAYAPSCNGMPTPPTQDPTDPSWPASCDYTGNTVPVATGVLDTGTDAITWDACSAAPDYWTTVIADYTPSDVSTGPGCLNNYRSYGMVVCAPDGTNSAFCSFGDLVPGPNPADTSWVQPLINGPLVGGTNSVAVANDAQMSTIATPIGASGGTEPATLPQSYNVPNDTPSRTWVGWTALRNDTNVYTTCN